MLELLLLSCLYPIAIGCKIHLGCACTAAVALRVRRAAKVYSEIQLSSLSFVCSYESLCERNHSVRPCIADAVRALQLYP